MGPNLNKKNSINSDEMVIAGLIDVWFNRRVVWYLQIQTAGNVIQTDVGLKHSDRQGYSLQWLNQVEESHRSFARFVAVGRFEWDDGVN